MILFCSLVTRRRKLFREVSIILIDKYCVKYVSKPPIKQLTGSMDSTGPCWYVITRLSKKFTVMQPEVHRHELPDSKQSS
jgi:hypothetical protein